MSLNQGPTHTKMPKRRIKYTPQTVINVQYVYILAAISWLLIIFAVLIYWRKREESYVKNGLVGILILALPLLAFGVSFVNAKSITKDQEQSHWNGDYLTFASVTVLILINLSKSLDKEKSYRLIMSAFLLLMLSLIGIWTRPEDQPIVVHTRGAFQTAGLSLLAYALYTAYAHEVPEEVVAI